MTASATSGRRDALAARLGPAAYLALVLAPLAAAAAVDPFRAQRAWLVEASVACGFLALPLMLLQFGLVSRLRPLSRPFGTDALVLLHQYMGFLAVALVLVHPILLNTRGLPLGAWNPLAGGVVRQSGAAAAWAVVCLVVATVLRRRMGVSYEAWRSVHLALSLLAAAAALVHVLAVRGYSSAPLLRGLLWAYALIALAFTLEVRLLRPLRQRGRPWEVIANRDAGASTRTLRLRPVGHSGFAFEPGQFAWLTTGGSPFSREQHPLSIASSAASRGELEFAIKALGDWSTGVVPHLAVGSRVWVDGPFGAFTPDRRAVPGVVLIAGGIGIAPMRSIVLTLADRRDPRPVVLFHAAHDETRVAFRDEMEALRSRLKVDLIYVLEEPATDRPAERGLISAELLSRRLPAEHRAWHHLICGPPPMVDAVEEALRALGVPRSLIDSERFNLV